MRKLGARIGARQCGDCVRLTKQEAQHIQMMHTHIGECQTVIVFKKSLPMRDGAHLDCRHHRRAQLTIVENLLQHAHRLVVAHVLID